MGYECRRCLIRGVGDRPRARVYVKKDGKWQSVAFQQTPIVP